MKSNHAGMPHELVEVIDAGEAMLSKYGFFAKAMTESAEIISERLAEGLQLDGEQGRVEIAGGDVTELLSRLDKITEQRLSQVRRRAAASGALMRISGEIDAVQQKAQVVRSVYAGVLEFITRWNAEIVGKANAMSSEAAAATLLREFGVSIPTLSCLDVPSALEAIDAVLAKLEAARCLCASVRQGVNLSSQCSALSRERGSNREMGGIFVVSREFQSLGTTFMPGQLLDATVLTTGLLDRFWKGKTIRPLAESVAGVAA